MALLKWHDGFGHRAASFEGRIEVLRLLLEKRAYINARQCVDECFIGGPGKKRPAAFDHKNDTDALLLYSSFFLSPTKTRKQVQSQVRGKGFPKPPLIHLMRPASLSLDISIFFLILPQPSRISHEDILYQRFISLTPLFALCNE